MPIIRHKCSTGRVYTYTIMLIMMRGIYGICMHRMSAKESVCHAVDRHGQDEAKSEMEAKEEAAQLDPVQKAERKLQHTERAEFWQVAVRGPC